jgi:hypothetical protein
VAAFEVRVDFTERRDFARTGFLRRVRFLAIRGPLRVQQDADTIDERSRFYPYDNRRVGRVYHPAVCALTLVGLLGHAWAADAAEVVQDDVCEILIRRTATDIEIEMTDVKVE